MSPLPTVRVKFLPGDFVCDARKGETLLNIAKENHIPIQFECDGNLTCGTCYVVIESGSDQLSKISKPEQDHLTRQDLPNSYRLSCQARVLGNTSVRVLR